MKNRWNAQRVAERIPEAELESKMATLKREREQFRRNRRMELTQLWNLLYRGDSELSRSLAQSFTVDDVLNMKAAILRRLAREEQLTVAESYRRFQEFKALTSVRLQLTDSNPFPNLSQPRPSYGQMRHGLVRQATLLNDVSFSRIIDGSYRQQQQQQDVVETSSSPSSSLSKEFGGSTGTRGSTTLSSCDRISAMSPGSQDNSAASSRTRESQPLSPPTKTTSGVYMKRQSTRLASNADTLVNILSQPAVSSRGGRSILRQPAQPAASLRGNTVLFPIVRTQNCSPAAADDVDGVQQTEADTTSGKLQLPCITERSCTSSL